MTNKYLRDSNLVGPLAIMSILTLIAEGTSAITAASIGVVPGAQTVRILHAVFAASILFAALLSKKKWSREVTSLLFLALVSPFFATVWLNHVGYVRLDAQGAALAGPKLIFLVLAVLVPGPVWLNVGLLAGFALESFVIWRVLAVSDVAPVLPHEPLMTGLFAVVAFALLWFRQRDEKLIRQISAGKAREEALAGMARVFLSLRSLSNSPLQTLSLSLELMRKRHPEFLSSVDPMSSAVEKLNRMNRIYNRLESEAEWVDQPLMDEEEIARWIDVLEKRRTSVRT